MGNSSLDISTNLSFNSTIILRAVRANGTFPPDRGLGTRYTVRAKGVARAIRSRAAARPAVGGVTDQALARVPLALIAGPHGCARQHAVRVHLRTVLVTTHRARAKRVRGARRTVLSEDALVNRITAWAVGPASARLALRAEPTCITTAAIPCRQCLVTDVSTTVHYFPT